MRKQVAIIGVGMGNRALLTLEVNELVEKADLILGSKRAVEILNNKDKAIFLSYHKEEIVLEIEKFSGQRFIVAMSGDTGFYSGAASLLPLLSAYSVTLHCGISSVAYFCSKLGVPWEDVFSLSIHGRNANIIHAVRKHKKVFLLTSNNTKEILRELSDAGFDNIQVSIGENLSYESERIKTAKVRDLTNEEFGALNVMLIENKTAIKKISYGILDKEFIRGTIPMTKSEIRCLSLSKLELSSESICWDIGAGTGSVSIEIAMLLETGIVYAIEKKEEAIQLIRQNKEKFGLSNMEIIFGNAPEILKKLPLPDCVFIGGSSGNLIEILNLVFTKNAKAKVVVNSVSLETLTQLLAISKREDIKEFECVQVGVTKIKEMGNYHMMLAQNSVWIASFRGDNK